MTNDSTTDCIYPHAYTTRGFRSVDRQCSGTPTHVKSFRRRSVEHLGELCLERGNSKKCGGRWNHGVGFEDYDIYIYYDIVILYKITIYSHIVSM